MKDETFCGILTRRPVSNKWLLFIGKLYAVAFFLLDKSDISTVPCYCKLFMNIKSNGCVVLHQMEVG